MNDTARRLRAQKAYSTDPDYLERLACEEEARGSSPSTVPHAEARRAEPRKRPPALYKATHY